MDHSYLFAQRPGAYHFSMDSPQSQARRGIRYSLNLPVSLTLAHKKFQARSESISLGGILLSSASLVPEGSVVEVEVRVANLPQPGTHLSARGTVLRVQPRATGDFSVAVVFDRPMEFRLEDLKSGTDLQLKDQKNGDQRCEPRFPSREKFVTARGLNRGSTWFMET
jgi:hypothetical protein